MRQPKPTVEMPVDGKRGKTRKLFFYPSHRPWKSIQPISTFPPSRRLRRDDVISKTNRPKGYAFCGQVQAPRAIPRFSAIWTIRDLLPQSHRFTPVGHRRRRVSLRDRLQLMLRPVVPEVV